MPRKIIIEITDNYLVWQEFSEIDLMAKMNAKEFKSKEEVLKEVEKLLPELKEYEEKGQSYEGSPYDDFDD